MAWFFNWRAWNQDQSITATEDNDFIVTGNGDDEINALGGNDRIYAGRGYNTIDAGDGDDFVLTLWDGSSITGGLGDDRIRALGGPNTIDAGDGNDRIRSGRGDDMILGADGNDDIRAGGGDDVIEGGLGSDYLDGGQGTDTALFSGQFADYDLQITGWNRATVTNSGNGDIDTVRRIETLEFDDAFVHIRGRSVEVEYKNAAPSAIALDNAAVAENSAGAAVGRLTVTDPDDDTHAFVVSDDRFEVVAGELRLKAGETLDFETEPSISLEVTATDAGGLSLTETFVITVNNVAEEPSDIELSGGTVDENSAIDTVVGTFSVVDPEGDSTLSLTDDAGGLFKLVDNELQVAGALDAETAVSHTVTVLAIDPGGGTYEETFLITVNNVAEAPTDIELSGGTVDENSPIDTVVGTFSVVDPEGDSTLSLVDDAGGLFKLVDNELQVAGALDAETAVSHTVTVLATDPGGGTYEETFLITVNNLSDTPPVAFAQSLATNEDAGILGTLQAMDADGDDVDFAIVEGSEVGGTVTVFNPDTGAFTFKPDKDFSGVASFLFIATDGTDTSEPETVTIDVAPAADAPELGMEVAPDVLEDTPVDIDIVVELADTDGSETISRVVLSDFPEGATFSLGALDGSLWVIDNPDEIAALASTSLTMTPPADYNGSFSMTVQATVGDTATLSNGTQTDFTTVVGTVDIVVTPVNDAPVAANGSGETDEEVALNGVLPAATDAEGEQITYAAGSTNPANGDVIVNPDGTFTYTPTENSSGIDSFSYTVTDESGGANEYIYTVTVTPVNDAPLALDDSFGSDSDAEIFMIGGGAAYSAENNGDGTFTVTPLSSDNVTRHGAAIGDLNGDGNPDVFVVQDGRESVWINDGSGNLNEVSNVTTISDNNNFDVELADIDGDGDIDAIVISRGNNPTRVWLNDGNANFSQGANLSYIGREPTTFDGAVGDLDGDGDLDIIEANNGANLIWLNQGSGIFNLNNTITFGDENSDSRDVTLADLNGDNVLDIFIGNKGSGNTVWINNGDAANPAFTEISGGLGDADTRAVALGDLNGDGTVDAFVANSGTPGAPNEVWFNDGDGNFALSDNNGVVLGDYTSLDVGLIDFDGDGDLDALVANDDPTEPNLIWFNDGDGNFTSDGTAIGTFAAKNLALGDLDGDAALAASETHVLDVLANDTDIDASDTLTITSISPGDLAGALTIAPDGRSIEFDPSAAAVVQALPANALETFTFEYTVSDGNGGTDIAAVEVTVRAANGAPQTAVGSGTGAEDVASIAVDLSGTDADGTVTSFTISSLPTNGTIYADADLTTALGEDVFIFNIGDGRVTVTDFDPGLPGPGNIVDRIEFKGLGPQLNSAALDSNSDGFFDASDTNVAGSGAPDDPLTLTFGAHDALIITGISTLTQDDVLFT